MPAGAQLVGATVLYELHCPEQTTLYRLVQQHAATFFEQTDAASAADLPQFVKDELDGLLELVLDGVYRRSVDGEPIFVE